VLKDDDVGVWMKKRGEIGKQKRIRGYAERLRLCFKRASNPFQLGLSVRAIGLDRRGGDS
jgi:hypothetical protein